MTRKTANLAKDTALSLPVVVLKVQKKTEIEMDRDKRRRGSGRKEGREIRE